MQLVICFLEMAFGIHSCKSCFFSFADYLGFMAAKLTYFKKGSPIFLWYAFGCWCYYCYFFLFQSHHITFHFLTYFTREVFLCFVNRHIWSKFFPQSAYNTWPWGYKVRLRFGGSSCEGEGF